MKFKLLLSILFVSVLSIGSSYASFPVTATNTLSTTTQVSELNEDVEMTTPAAAAERRTVAIILAFVSVLLLPFGFHNWYLGRKKQALWQTLMVFPGFILIIPPLVSWVWQIVDLVRILSKDPKFD